jgi:hypothetical protein
MTKTRNKIVETGGNSPMISRAGAHAHTRKGEAIQSQSQRLYEQGLGLLADHILKDGSRVGSKNLNDFNRGFVDAVYAKLLVKESKDAQGNLVTRTRRRFANAAMIACRRAWNVGKRAEEKIVPEINPFAKMGLKKRGPGEKPRETPTATWEELALFRAKTRELGYWSVGTAALAAFEWLQREEHLIGAFLLSHYRPSARRNAVRVVHPKNGEEAWWPLFDEKQQQPERHPLFPELMAELDAIKSQSVVGIDGLMFRRDHQHRRGKVPLPSRLAAISIISAPG